jgi:hypothetical protein
LPDEVVDQRVRGDLKPGAELLFNYLLRKGADRPKGVTVTTPELVGSFPKPRPDRSTVVRYLHALRGAAWIDYTVGPGQRDGYDVRTGRAWREAVGEPSPSAPANELDELWRAVEAEGMKAPAAKSPRASFAKLVHELEATGAAPEDVRRWAAAYRRHPTLGRGMLTLPALVKWAPQLDDGGGKAAPPCPGCGINSGEHSADCGFAEAGEVTPS